MTSRSDSQPRGRRGGRNKPSQGRGQGHPMVSANEFTSSPVPSFQPIPYNGPQCEVPGSFSQSNPNHPQLVPYSRIPPPLFPPEDSTFAGDELDLEPAREVYGNSSTSLPSQGVVNERLRAASDMIVTKGKEIDVLQKHQGTCSSRAPSQECLRLFGDSLYSRAYASRQSSRNASLANSSFISFHSDVNSSQAPSNKNTELWKSYSPRDQEVLAQAHILMIYEMATNIGWPMLSSGETTRKRWKDTIREVLSQASAKIPGELLTPTKGIERLLMRALTLFRAELASRAAPFAKLFFVNDDPAVKTNATLLIQWKESECERITDASDASHFFMHERDDEGRIIQWFGNRHLESFHVNFWYMCDCSPMKAEVAKDIETTPLQMYTLSAVALFYAMKRKSRRFNDTLPHMPFTGAEFSPVFEAYIDSLCIAMKHRVIGARLDCRLKWLHQCGVEKMKPCQAPPPSPQKQRNTIFIPPAEEIGAYESYLADSQLFDRPVNLPASFFTREHYPANSHPADTPVHSTTSTAGASCSDTRLSTMEAAQPSSSGGWSMELEGLGLPYYQYDL
ncbi:hypothetical protein EDD15DRAFT_2205856 [Pisolithus albus]|nr:hypothetical protein EDD15DRAFT_2205856 [Pisolithus albus]